MYIGHDSGNWTPYVKSYAMTAVTGKALIDGHSYLISFSDISFPLAGLLVNFIQNKITADSVAFETIDIELSLYFFPFFSKNQNNLLSLYISLGLVFGRFYSLVGMAL